MWLVALAIGLAVLYAGAVAFISFTQTQILFPTKLAAGSQPLPASAERLEIATPDGARLIGVKLPPKLGSSDGGPLLLGFGGNAWNAETMAFYLHNLYPQADVVAFHYRGYAPSSGKPSAEALLNDALVIYDQLQQPSSRPILPIGFSIGSGVAASLAAQRPVAGLIMVTPFDTLDALARDHFPWLPVGLLLRHHIPTVDFVRMNEAPTALIMAGRDTIVPARRSEPLRSAAPHLVFDLTVADAGHNDLYGHPAFMAGMREAMEKIEAATAASPALPQP